MIIDKSIKAITIGNTDVKRIMNGVFCGKE